MRYSRALAERLRQRGHDVSAVLDDPDFASARDVEVFGRARREGRAMVTRDLADYRVLAGRILADGGTHAGLILVTDRAFPEHNARTPGRLFAALLALVEADVGLEGREVWLQ